MAVILELKFVDFARETVNLSEIWIVFIFDCFNVSFFTKGNESRKYFFFCLRIAKLMISKWRSVSILAVNVIIVSINIFLLMKFVSTIKD